MRSRFRLLRLAVVVGATAALTAGVGVMSAGAVETTEVFSFTGDVQSFTVPEDVCTIGVAVYGGAGGDSLRSEDEEEESEELEFTAGGLGGQASGILEVTPGETLDIVVGGAGGTGLDDIAAGLGAYPNGGNGGFRDEVDNQGDGAGGGGGGSSSISLGGELLAIAGGGGGAGGYWDSGAGGDGGGNGTDGLPSTAAGGQGGQSGGNGGAGGLGGNGIANGTDGTPEGLGGEGGGSLDGGGGGGGGFHGGGGGGGLDSGDAGGGGGGGGSGFGVAGITQVDGMNFGDGSVVIVYDVEADTCGSGEAPAAVVVEAAPRFTG